MRAYFTTAISERITGATRSNIPDQIYYFNVPD